MMLLMLTKPAMLPVPRRQISKALGRDVIEPSAVGPEFLRRGGQGHPEVVEAGTGRHQAQELILVGAAEQAQGHPAVIVKPAGQERLDRRLSLPGELGCVVLRHRPNGTGGSDRTCRSQ